MHQIWAENVHTPIVFRVIKRLRKELSVEWEEQKNRRSRTKEQNHGQAVCKSYKQNQCISERHVVKNLCIFNSKFIDSGREITKGSLKCKYFQKSLQNRFRELNCGLKTLVGAKIE